MTNKKVFTTISGLVLAAAVFAGCSESTIEKVEPVTETEQTETAAPEVAETKELKIGETVDVNGLQIKLNSVKKVMGTNEYDQPSNGMYLVLDVVVENVSAESANISSMLNFTLMDAEGYSQDLTIMPELKGSLDGEIGSGRKLAGQIGFDVAESGYYEFIYEEVFAGGQAIWKFTPEEVTQ